jgi:hypothetical protein
MILLQIMVIFCLGFIFYQDLLYRAVYWLCFLVLAILMFSLKYKLCGLGKALVHTGYGLSFLTFQLFILWIYFSIKRKKVISVTGDYLGWGDILFLVAIAFYLSPGNYIVFYVVSLIVVLIYTLTATLLSNKERNPHIPLAGLQAALLCLLMAVDEFSSKFMLYDDSWLFF